MGGSRARTILLIEDDRVVRTAARHALKHAGYEVTEAADGAEGLAAFARCPPDLILLDVVMPGQSGFDVCRTVRQAAEGVDVPVLMMTANDDVASIHEAFAAGATDFISKPLPVALLSYRVQYLLRSADAMRDLRRSERRLDDAQKAARLGYWDWSAADDELRLSPLSRGLFGEGGRFAESFADILQLIHADDVEQVRLALQRTCLARASMSIEFRLVGDDVDPVWIHARGEVDPESSLTSPSVSGTFQDISDIKKREAQTRYLAYFDTLTGLPNRVNLTAQLERKLATARRHRRSLSVLVLDLDNFKQVNETLGHAIGDQLLARVAARLAQCVRPEDDVVQLSLESADQSLARMGGDEFALVLCDVSTIAESESVAQRVLDAVRSPIVLDGHEVVISASAGIAIYPTDGEDLMDLLSHADSAMYAAKAAGGDRLAFFNAPLHSAAESRFSHEMALRRAIERGQLTLLYQPKMEIATGRIVGFEALVRWNHPEFGPVSPLHFIPIAERTGIILAIGEWVLRTALAQISAWRQSGIDDVSVAVNLSARQFSAPDLPERIAQLLQEFDVAASALEIEITESAIMDNIDVALQTTRDLRALGCRVAIDDFGTGYSSLAYIKQLSVDHLKIDRAFITGLAHDTEDSAIVQSIVDMANTLGIGVIAEGVESPEQLHELASRGCHVVQGYLLSRPIPADAVPGFLGERTNAVRRTLFALAVGADGFVQPLLPVSTESV